MNKVIPIGGEGEVVLRSNLKGVGLRKVNVLINYDLMRKDGSDTEGKERIVGDMF